MSSKGLARVAAINSAIAAQGNKGYSVAPGQAGYVAPGGGSSGSGSTSSTSASKSYAAPVQTSNVQKSSGSSILNSGGSSLLYDNTPLTVNTQLRPGEVPQVYSGSTTGSIARDYTSPIGSYSPQNYTPIASTYTSNTGGGGSSVVKNPLARAYDAISGLVSNVGSKVSGFLNTPLTQNTNYNPSQAASPEFLNPQTSQQTSSTTPSTTTTAPSTDAPTAPIATTPPQVKPSIKDQYSVITQNKAADSATIRQNIDAVRAQEKSETEAQLQQLYKQLSDAQSKLATAQAQEQQPQTEQPAQEQGATPTTTFAQTYAPQNLADVSSLTSQIQAIQDEIAKAQQGSPEYQAAENAYNEKVAEEQAIKARLAQGQANIAEQPVAYSFISGQQAALERRANADLQTNAAQRVPLQMRVAQEQAKKQAALDVAKTKLGAAQDERSRLEDIYKTNYNRANTLADTASNRAYEASKPVTLSSGQTRIDANGNVIASTPGKTTTTSNSSNITKLKNALNESKFAGPEADGKYADPSLYLANYQSWLASGGSADEFFRNFPPASYINPANTWLPQEIMQFVKQSGSSSSRGAI